MNNKGQAIFYTLMMGIVIIILALALAFPVNQQANIARNVSTTETVGLDCNNSSISDFTKAECILTDLSTPYFFFGLLALAGVVIGAKLVFGGSQ